MGGWVQWCRMWVGGLRRVGGGGRDHHENQMEGGVAFEKVEMRDDGCPTSRD